jgi:hypothetical protein
MTLQPGLDLGEDKHVMDGDRRSGMNVKVTLIWVLGTVLVAAITTAGGVVSGWLQYRGPGSETTEEPTALSAEGSLITAMIVSPTPNEEVSLCTSVLGIAPATRDIAAYWLIVRGPDQFSDFYLTRRVVPGSGRPLQWDLTASIGGPDDAGLEFNLLLVYTEGFLTRDFGARLERSDWNLGDELPPDATVVDEVGVLRTDDINC